MWIKRDAEDLIRGLGNQFPVVFVTGARQVGKTSILTHLFPDFAYVTLDDPAMAEEAVNAPQDFLNSLKLPSIIDEAQYAPELFRHIKLIVDKAKLRGQFFLTGSQSFPLMQNLSESLSGRSAIVNLQPLSAHELSNAGLLTSIGDYISAGGFPALYADNGIDRKYWYPSYISTYLERDVRNIMHVGSLRDFNRFLRAAAVRTAQTLSFADLSRDVGVSPNTIKVWISVLEASHIIYLLEPYHRSLGKRLVKSPKLFFLDTGLAAHLMGLYSWHEITNSHMSGALWETYAFNQIQRRLLSQGINNPPIYYWRTKGGREVDFIVEKGGRFINIEAKMTGSPTSDTAKGFSHFKDYYGADAVLKEFIICRVSKDYAIGKGVKAITGVDIEL
ncbi:ATP-binding protein [Candidatus Magnetominusculus dajiuhuensis]|uniref:ATP-binding protein n=1 Tax=Candidatus Magnetominusculus dajiuhuensis TaxID=3137712 RepID=UPI003B434A5C